MAVPQTQPVKRQSWPIRILTIAGYITCFGFVSTIASVIAAVLGTISTFLIWAGPDGIAAVAFIPIIPLFAFPIGFLLSIPVTFILLPIGVLCLRRFRALLPFGAGLIGLIGGGLVTWLWTRSAAYPKFLANADVASALILSGCISGLIVGVFYGQFGQEAKK
jgi:hypothetical protein